MNNSNKAALKQPKFLPTSPGELAALGWSLDVLLVSGDAYVDHPSFATALLGRWLVEHGFGVAVAAQPAWEGDEAVQALAAWPRPRLFAGVSAGSIDSMLAHYTAFRKKRHDDAYTPGGKTGARPNRACIVYTGLVRQAFPGLPVVLGGIEASLRRISHYDFWSDSLRRSLLLDSKADILIYGMGETALLGIADAARALADGAAAAALESGLAEQGIERAALARACRAVPGLAFTLAARECEAWLKEHDPEAVRLPPHEAIAASPALLMQATLLLEGQVHQGKRHAVQSAGDRAVILTPPAPPLAEKEMDFLYSLPYSRLPHPSYTEAIPAWEMIRTSITTHRGCGGGCSFCSLALHQGRRIASRSRASVLDEAGTIAAGPKNAPGGKPPRWAGSISDVGGPSANMWQARCALPKGKDCARASCLTPAPCPLFCVDQGRGVRLLREIAALPGVRHVRVASGVRFDMALKEPQALYAYTSEFTGGQLKVAPEHSAPDVLRLMRKPDISVFERFLEEFKRHCLSTGKELYTVPYLLSAFPGCTEHHMRDLAAWLKKKNWSPRQVQCFIPTPGTVATAMYYAGIDPEGKTIHVARSDKERLRQHHLLLGDSGRSGDSGKSGGAGGNADRGGNGDSGRGRDPRGGGKSDGKSGGKGSGRNGRTLKRTKK